MAAEGVYAGGKPFKLLSCINNRLIRLILFINQLVCKLLLDVVDLMLLAGVFSLMA
jgi:hypothetical protein